MIVLVFAECHRAVVHLIVGHRTVVQTHARQLSSVIARIRTIASKRRKPEILRVQILFSILAQWVLKQIGM